MHRITWTRPRRFFPISTNLCYHIEAAHGPRVYFGEHTFRELFVGGVLVAPFLTYAIAALFVVLLIRPLLRFVGFLQIFSNAAIVELSLYVTILGLLILYF